MRFFCVWLACVFVLWSGICSADPGEEAFVRLLESVPSTQAAKPNARIRVLRTSAKAYGFQWQYQRYLDGVERLGQRFATVFDFRRLLLADKVVPPVVVAVGSATAIASDTLATSFRKQYRIIAPARMVAEPPSHYDYLLSTMDVVQPPARLLPKTAQEKQQWKEALHEGWVEGLAHAKTVFDANMERLLRDYRGIVRFRLLEKEGLIASPSIAKGGLDSEVSDTVLTVDPSVVRITAPGRFTKRGSHE